MLPLSLRTPQEVAEDLASRIRALRLDRNWKRETLARRSGVTVASLKRFENSGKISLENLLLLARALGRLDDFATVFEPPPARSLDELEARHEGPRRHRGRE